MVLVLEMNLRILVLSRYSRLGASSRLRTLQYRSYLEKAGFEVEYAALFDDTYLQDVYAGIRNKLAILSYYQKRLSSLKGKADLAVIWVEYEALPWLPWDFERLFLPKGVPVVSDYDDAVFHRYDRHGLWPVRWMLGRKIDLVMQHSALVTAGNGYLADRAEASGARRVEIVPTVVDLEHYALSGTATKSVTPQIGWIGSPSTWTEYMVPMMPALTAVAAAEGARIMAVGAGKAAARHDLLDNLPWTEESEVARIQEMDIGIMPLTDTPWARGKCGYKLIQYMACGLPIIASPFGVNAEIVEHGVNGFHAATDAEWRTALVTLSRDPDLRQRMGAAGRRKVEQQYSLQVWGPAVANMLAQIARGPAT